MKIIIALFLASTCILTTSFIEENAKPYKIIGSAIGFSDSTLLYLDDLTDGTFKHMDSAYIIGEKFIFKGVLKTKIIKAAITTADFNDRCYLWLENSTVYFKAEKGKFKNASIKGSKTQEEQNKLNVLLDNSKNQREQEFLFVRDNPQSIISAYTLCIYSSTWGRDTTEMLYKPFSAEIKNSFYGKAVFEYLTLNKNIKIGDKYVDFAQQNIQGKVVRLSDFNGKVILLEFWGSWCGPCRRGNPELVKIYNEFNHRGFEIFGVAAETEKEYWLDAVKKDGLTWQNVSDLNGDKNKAVLIYGVSSYPTNFLIDRTGTIIAKDLSGENLRKKLTEIL
ncbi:MAG TPA: AhpC/TSA family protein [Chitinophagaceae bacterium]|nr:AhpC/TSA family protein [Chitinophagaceae bacterium]